MAKSVLRREFNRSETEARIDKAVHVVYMKYGDNLAAFFRDVLRKPQSSVIIPPTHELSDSIHAIPLGRQSAK